MQVGINTPSPILPLGLPRNFYPVFVAPGTHLREHPGGETIGQVSV